MTTGTVLLQKAHSFMASNILCPWIKSCLWQLRILQLKVPTDQKQDPHYSFPEYFQSLAVWTNI